jgi:hypothetical protein
MQVSLTDDIHAAHEQLRQGLDREDSEQAIRAFRRSPRKDPYHSTGEESDKMPDWEIKYIYGLPERMRHDGRVSGATESFTLEVVYFE